MTSSPDIQMDELKEDVIHLEVPTATVAATEKQEVMLDSAYARTPLWVLARKFWKAGLYTIGVSIGALFDGETQKPPLLLTRQGTLLRFRVPSQPTSLLSSSLVPSRLGRPSPWTPLMSPHGAACRVVCNSLA